MRQWQAEQRQAALGAVKYYSFFAQSCAHVLHDVGLGMPLPLLTIALPVGISFFTFQAISYTVDVKRRLIEPASLLDVAIRSSTSGARLPLRER